LQVVVIIPARYGSTRFPGKPLAKIHGKPMIQHVAERCGKAGCVARVAVATDDDRIREVVEGFGGTCVMTPPELASGTDRVHAAAVSLGLSAGDVVVNVQGDQPLVAPGCIDEVVAPLLADPACAPRTMSTLALKIVREKEITDPKDVKVVFSREGFALYFSRAAIPCPRDADTRPDYYKHLGVYAYTVDFLDAFSALPRGVLEDVEKLEQLRALEHGLSIKVVVTLHDSPEVDLPEDIAWMESNIRPTPDP